MKENKESQAKKPNNVVICKVYRDPREKGTVCKCQKKV